MSYKNELDTIKKSLYSSFNMTSKEEILNIFDEAKNLNYKIEMVSNIKSGKEATVYKILLNDQLVAMKLYKKPEERSFKNTDQYLIGKFYKKPSHRKAVAKGNKFAKKLKHENWVKREFFMLEKLYDLGAKIPKPILQIKDSIFMEFLGNNEISAPRLCDIVLSQKEAKYAFEKIIETMVICWNFGIVHADLSEYNILWWENEPYIIDFPQSLDKRTHPNIEEILNRDLKNITKFFGKFIKIDFNETKKAFS